MARRETYEAELPDGVLCLTCGVDTQDDRLEYEVRGYGHYGESWGIKKGIIMGKPDTPEVWEKLDDVIDHAYKFKDGLTLRVSTTFVDSVADTIDLRVAQQAHDPGTGEVTITNVKHIMVIAPKKVALGSVKPHTLGDVSGEYSVRYFATYKDGECVIEVDQANYKFVVNGVDYAEPVRKALGM